MANHAYCRVDPRLAQLLGESYRSTEHALRELVDNAWDADAVNVSISLPQPHNVRTTSQETTGSWPKKR
jgi:hypothetical protein